MPHRKKRIIQNHEVGQKQDLEVVLGQKLPDRAVNRNRDQNRDQDQEVKKDHHHQKQEENRQPEERRVQEEDVLNNLLKNIQAEKALHIQQMNVAVQLRKEMMMNGGLQEKTEMESAVGKDINLSNIINYIINNILKIRLKLIKIDINL